MRKKVWIGIWILAWAALGAGVILLLNRLTFQRLDAPLYLLGLLLLAPLAFLVYRSGQLQQKRLDLLYDHALQSRLFIKRPAALWRQYLPFIALLACCFVALARPQGPMVLGSATSNGVDILIGIDVSDSMKATDESYPNRMGAAANVIRQLLPFFEGDRVGLFVFSGEAFSLAPFTYDHGTLNTFLDEINTNLLPSETTDLEEAFKHALTRFGLNPEKQKNAVVPQEKTGQLLMLFSDGENQLGDYNDEVGLLAKSKVPVFTVGLGTTAGARIPVNTMMGRSYKMWRGQPAVTKLNPKLLARIAKQTSGTYLPLKSINQLPAALSRAKGNLQINSNDRKIQQFEERYVYWLLFGFLLFFTLPLLWSINFQAVPAYRFRFKKKGLKKMSAAKGIPIGLVVVLLSPLLQSAWSPSSDWNSLWNYFYSSQGQKAYEAKDFEEAEKSFEQGLEADPDNAVLRNNQAHAQYKGNNYDKAVENFKENLEQEQLTSQQKANTHYNLGNSYFRQGEKSWEDAVKSYQEALKINPKDKQALENLNFVQEKIAQQKKQQKQGNDSKNQQQQQKKGDNPDKNQEKDNNDGNKKPQQTPQSVPTPEPSPQYYDKKELEEALKQREEDERRNKNNFHRFRKKQKQAAKDKAGEPWEQDVKNW